MKRLTRDGRSSRAVYANGLNGFSSERLPIPPVTWPDLRLLPATATDARIAFADAVGMVAWREPRFHTDDAKRVFPARDEVISPQESERLTALAAEGNAAGDGEAAPRRR